MLTIKLFSGLPLPIKVTGKIDVSLGIGIRKINYFLKGKRLPLRFYPL
jgi:hypothetical protein